MKLAIKYYLSELGILPHLDSIRRYPQTRRWISAGCKGIAPPHIKRKILMAYLHKYALDHFIETGTHLGDTLAYIAINKDTQCTSSELGDLYYQKAKERFKSYRNVELLNGDSGALIPMVVDKLTNSALFWLDGHYSGGVTAQGETDTPVSAELRAIFSSPCKTHVILIDDARCFDGSNGYPHLDDLLKTVRIESNYHAEISADIIRLTPRSLS